MENKCWMYDTCNHIDCNTICIKKYKLDYLFKESLLEYNQRFKKKLVIDKDNSDLDNFTYLSKVENNITRFVSQGCNLYIHSSNCGNGKTSWAIRLIQSYLNKIWYKSELRCRALFINVPRFLIALKNNIEEKDEYVLNIRRNVLVADLVVWDEIGSKGLTQFEHENILSLINARIDSGKSNIYTSNLSSNELHDTIGDRLYSRIVNYSDDVELNGSDKRGLIV